MEGLRLNVATKIKRQNARVTRVVDKPRFIAVEHTIQAQWEELASIALLNF